MDRQKAVSFIKEIFEQCHSIEGKSIKLLPPKENNSLSSTFQIHIEVKDDLTLQSCVHKIAAKNNLAVAKKDGVLIVYKPYPNLIMP
jgi:hypothetical protein